MSKRIKDIISKSNISSEMTQEELIVFLEKRKNNGLPKSINVGKRYLSIQYEVIKLQKEFNELSFNDKYYFLEDDTMKACKNITYKLSELLKDKLAKERKVWDKFWNIPSNDIDKDWDNYKQAADKRSTDLAQIEHDYKIDVENTFKGYHQFRKLIENEFFDVWLRTKSY